MALDSSQLAVFKTDILSNTDPVVVDALAGGSNTAIADWYNQEAASPGYWIYRNFVTSNEVRNNIDAQNIADMTSADRDRAVQLLVIRAERGFSGANPRDRSAWDDIFSGAAGDESQQAIATIWTRLATNAEKVFSLSTGSGADAANADTTSFQGRIALDDVRNALAS